MAHQQQRPADVTNPKTNTVAARTISVYFSIGYCVQLCRRACYLKE